MKLYVFLLRACLLITFSWAYVSGPAAATPSDQHRKTVDMGELNKGGLKIPIVVPPYRNGEDGVVRVRVWIDKKGDVFKTLVVSGPKSLRSAAVRSARGSEFPPDFGNCPSCPYVTGILTYTFLNQDPSRHNQ
jgi:hypothetical protein